VAKGNYDKDKRELLTVLATSKKLDLPINENEDWSEDNVAAPLLRTLALARYCGWQNESIEILEKAKTNVLVTWEILQKIKAELSEVKQPLAKQSVVALSQPDNTKTRDPNTKDIHKLIKRFIKSKNKALKADRAHADPKKWLIGDIDNDGVKDLVLQYSLLGPTWWFVQVEVFPFKNGTFQKSIGMQLDGEGDLQGIDNGNILISEERYVKDDPRCCPSQKHKAKYIVKGDKLVNKSSF